MFLYLFKWLLTVLIKGVPHMRYHLRKSEQIMPAFNLDLVFLSLPKTMKFYKYTLIRNLVIKIILTSLFSY